MKKIASEIIAEQRTEIEEQIVFYEELRQNLLAEANKIEVKTNRLRKYLDEVEW